jgi:XRN 5'-3' exonuclease N-terminus
MLYLAVDGVAPRAKMNQQRSRRFRAAKEAEMAAAERVARSTVQMEQQVVKTSSGGSSSSSGLTFDSNCITPGTDFMIKLSIALQKWVAYKQETDDVWKNGADVIVSGPDVPGEGEHKVAPHRITNPIWSIFCTVRSIDRCVCQTGQTLMGCCCWLLLGAHTCFYSLFQKWARPFHSLTFFLLVAPFFRFFPLRLARYIRFGRRFGHAGFGHARGAFHVVAGENVRRHGQSSQKFMGSTESGQEKGYARIQSQ